MEYSANGFEIETCSRCGGTGHYSYNQMTGTRCFKCNGNKVVFTKRGAAAAEFYSNSLKVELGSLKVGDLMRCNHMINPCTFVNVFAEVVEIGPEHVYGSSTKDGVQVPMTGITVRAINKKYGEMGLTAHPSYMVRKGWDGATKAAKLAEAIAYQATLTKAGKPMQRKAA